MQGLNSEELARLSPEERLALIGQLWDSLTWEQLRAELARRRP